MQPFKLIALFFLFVFGKEGYAQNSESKSLRFLLMIFKKKMELKLKDRKLKLVNFGQPGANLVSRNCPIFSNCMRSIRSAHVAGEPR